jgi:ABC-type antimicrobial peptide transport system permease subunit
MNLKAFRLIFVRQITQKWSRFLLASGGILIGVWAISLISSLGFGVNNAIVKAINSQASIRRIDVSKVKGGEYKFDEEPEFYAFSKQEFYQDFDNSKIADKDLEHSVDLFFHSKLDSTEQNCQKEFAAIDPLNQAELSGFDQSCTRGQLRHVTWSEFEANFGSKFVDGSSKPKTGQIAVCFRCGNYELNEKIGISEPKDLLGKKITLEFTKTSPLAKIGQLIQARNVNNYQYPIAKTQPISYEISAVVDDRDTQAGLSNIATASANFWLNPEEYEVAFDQVELPFEKKDGGYLSASVFVNSYDDLAEVETFSKDKGYAPIAALKFLADQIGTAALVLSFILSGFGIIAMIASVFGIINVMTISVLERRKEIGVLKSLGAKDRDIFFVFLLESSFLGLVGWLLAMLATLLSNSLVSVIFKAVLASNESWRNNLQGLGINAFEPTLPWYIAVGTLGLALVFTTLSGIFPAIRASRQNPVDVLRSE